MSGLFSLFLPWPLPCFLTCLRLLTRLTGVDTPARKLLPILPDFRSSTFSLITFLLPSLLSFPLTSSIKSLRSSSSSPSVSMSTSIIACTLSPSSCTK